MLGATLGVDPPLDGLPQTVTTENVTNGQAWPGKSKRPARQAGSQAAAGRAGGRAARRPCGQATWRPGGQAVEREAHQAAMRPCGQAPAGKRTGERAAERLTKRFGGRAGGLHYITLHPTSVTLPNKHVTSDTSNHA